MMIRRLSTDIFKTFPRSFSIQRSTAVPFLKIAPNESDRQKNSKFH